MRHRGFLVAGLAVFALGAQVVAVPSHAIAADRGAAYEELAEMAEARMRQASVPGLSILIVDDRGVLWRRGFGVTAPDGPTVEPGTVFRVGSISKPVTAVAVMQLVDRGRMTLNDPAQRLLPGFKPRSLTANEKAIPVRALLAHHSGLPGDSLRGMWDKTPVRVCDALPAIAGEWLVAPPETEYRYSNLDYTALGCMIETDRHRAFADAIQEDLLKPLGMTASIYGEPAISAKRLAKPHRGGLPVARTGLRDAPAGSLSASADDMGRFLRMLLARGEIDGQRILKPTTVTSLFQRQYDDSQSPIVQATGLGWMLSGQPIAGAGEAVWHSGQYPGYFSHIALLPSQRLGVVVLANDDNARQFALELATKALELSLLAKTGIAVPKRPGPPEAAPVDLDSATLERYAGRYVVSDDIVPVVRDGGRLSLRYQGRGIELVPVAKDRFVPRASFMFGLMHWPLDGISVRILSRDGHQYAVVEGLPAPLAFEKVAPGSIPENWRRRLGAWRVVNPDNWLQIKTARLEVNDGVLVLRVVVSSPVWGLNETPLAKILRPAGDNVAMVVSAAFGGGAVEATTRDGREVLIYSGYVFERGIEKGQ